MIAKILPRRGSDFNGVVNYSERKTDKGSGELIYSQGFISEDRKSVIDMLAYVSRQNLNVKNPIFHASISFPASENPEKEMLINYQVSFVNSRSRFYCRGLVYFP